MPHLPFNNLNLNNETVCYKRCNLMFDDREIDKMYYLIGGSLELHRKSIYFVHKPKFFYTTVLLQRMHIPT